MGVDLQIVAIYLSHGSPLANRCLGAHYLGRITLQPVFVVGIVLRWRDRRARGYPQVIN